MNLAKFWKSGKILKIGQNFENGSISKILKRASYPEQNFPQKIRASFTNNARAIFLPQIFRDEREQERGLLLYGLIDSGN